MSEKEDHKRNEQADAFTKWVMGIIAVLMGAGVMGMWNMNATVARLEERMAGYITISERLFTQIALDMRSFDARLDTIERVIIVPRQPQPQQPLQRDAYPPPYALPNKKDEQEPRR